MKRLLFVVPIIFIFSLTLFTQTKQTEFSLPDMINIKSGDFSMGNNSGHRDEKPSHRVVIDYNFKISKYEITYLQFVNMLNYAHEKGYLKISSKYIKNIAGQTKILYRFEIKFHSKNSPISFNGKRFIINTNFSNFPVTAVTWYGAAFYCNMLSEIYNLNTIYNLEDWSAKLFKTTGYRLPTEAEWEYSARGGSFSKNYKYSGSSSYLKSGWLKNNSNDQSHEIGKLISNEAGIFDMTGNISEWCNDYYDPNFYKSSKVVNPSGPSYKPYHSVRGGNYKSTHKTSSIYSRSYLPSEKSNSQTGFRPVLQQD